MPDYALFLTFMAAVTLLMLTPGPNVALIVANSVAYGPRYGFLTIAGTSSAQVGQLFLTGLGMAQLLGTLGVWFDWLRWAGVVYLLWLGIAQWRAPASDLSDDAGPPASLHAIYARALIVSLTNPKTLFFYAAFFPQFIAANRPVGAQMIVLSVTFLLIALTVDCGWVMLAHRARGVLGSSGKWRNRVSGGCLIGAGAILALAGRR